MDGRRQGTAGGPGRQGRSVVTVGMADGDGPLINPQQVQAVAEVVAPETKVIDVVAEPEVVVVIEPEVEPEVAEPVDDGRYGESLLREILDAKPLDDK